MSVIYKDQTSLGLSPLFILLQDKTVESLKKSLTKVKTVKEKAVTKIDNLKTIADSAEQEARPQKERARNTLNGVTPQLSPAKNTLEEASRKEPEVGVVAMLRLVEVMSTHLN